MKCGSLSFHIHCTGKIINWIDETRYARQMTIKIWSCTLQFSPRLLCSFFSGFALSWQPLEWTFESFFRSIDFSVRFCTAIVHFTVKSVMWESRSHITLIFAIATRLTGAMVNLTEARQQIASQATQFNDRSIRVIYMREYFHNRWFPFWRRSVLFYFSFIIVSWSERFDGLIAYCWADHFDVCVCVLVFVCECVYYYKMLQAKFLQL